MSSLMKERMVYICSRGLLHDSIVNVKANEKLFIS